MIELIESIKVLNIDNTDCLANKFIEKLVTPDQQHDLLSFREIGQSLKIMWNLGF
jgi:hypothetical protein